MAASLSPSSFSSFWSVTLIEIAEFQTQQSLCKVHNYISSHMTENESGWKKSTATYIHVPPDPSDEVMSKVKKKKSTGVMNGEESMWQR